MKKLILPLVIAGIFIISGCVEETRGIECQQNSDCQKGICEDGTEYEKYSCVANKCVLINYVQDPCQSEELDVSYKVGDTVEVGTEKFTIKDITQAGDVILINDRELTLEGTNNPAKAGNQEISILELDIRAPDSARRSVKLDIKDIQLSENEYALDYQKAIELSDMKVELKDVYDDKLDSILIKVSKGLSSEEKRINKGKTEEVLGFKITNIRPNPRPISYEKYAIVKIEEAI